MQREIQSFGAESFGFATESICSAVEFRIEGRNRLNPRRNCEFDG